MAHKQTKVIKDKSKFNWILWSVIGIVVISLTVGGIFLAKSLNSQDKDVDRITTFDSYDQLPFSYFLKEFIYEDSNTTTTTGTTTEDDEEPVLDEEPDTYYLFVYDGTKSCKDYGCSSVFEENIGYDKMLEEVKVVLDAAIANGIQVYVADVSQKYYTGFEGATIASEYVFTEEFNSAQKNQSAITVVGPALVKVENKYGVTVYYNGVEKLYRDIDIKVKNFESAWTW